jgi:VRR-NUC domain
MNATQPITERGFQVAVIQAAQVLGWQVAHFRPAQTAHGWRTPVAADGAGFPDLVLVRDRVLFCELKTGKGKLSAAQEDCLGALATAGTSVHCWTPDDWNEIEQVLR